MITLLFILAGAVILWILRHCWPFHVLIEVNQLNCIEAKGRNRSLKLLDVRDASEYLTGHIPGSINISTGRLPYVWQLNLSPDDDVVILSDNAHQRNKSARILRKHEFRHLYVWHGSITDSQKMICE